MRGTIFKHSDPHHKPLFAMVDPERTDEEIYAMESDMVANGYLPVPSEEEFMSNINPHRMPRNKTAEPATTNIKVRKSSRDKLNDLKRRWKQKTQSDTIDAAWNKAHKLESDITIHH